MKKTKMKRVPKLRFPEFTDDWEQRKAGDFMIESRESGHKGDQARKLTVKLWGKGVYEKDEVGSVNTQYFRRHSNQFIYSKLDFLNCAFGVVPESLEGLETTADVPAFDCNGINPYFMFFTAIQPDFYLKNGMIADGSRKAKRIHADTFLNMPIVLPCLDEQEKIVRVLKQLDRLITLHQRKIKNLNVLKKCVMQKLFSQKVRFKADDGSEFPKWKEKRLGDVFTERMERSKGGETLLSVTIAQGIVRQSETDKRNTASENKSNYKIVKRNDLAYNTMRMWQGAEGVSEYDGIVSPAYTVITALDGNNSYFFEILFKQTFMLQIFQRYSQGLTSDTWNLKFPTFSEIKCLVPCEDEQNKIVECVTVLDSVIEKQKATLAAWEELKKGLLQQMFV